MLCTALTLNVVASDHTWNSTGDVIYDEDGNKTVLFDVGDLDYLDDRIDEIESSVLSGKIQLANSLNQWELANDKVLSTTNPTFDQINTTLEYIKSVPNEGQVFTDVSGNPLYLKSDGSVTINVSEADSSDPITYTAATSQSLSAGSVAWINGQLIVGDGSYNKNYYEYGRLKSGIKRKLIASSVTSSGTYKQCADGTLFSSLDNITIDNFACIPKSVSGSGMVSSTGWYTASSNTTVSMSYSNGTLSISGLSTTSYDGSRQWNSCTSTIDLYLYYVE